VDRAIPAALVAALVSGCGGGGRTSGPSEFQSPGAGFGGLSTGVQGRDAKGMAGGSISSGAPAPAGESAGGGPAASGGEPRVVEEGDVVALRGTTLFVLNRYRGLQVVDVGDAKAPALLARVPLAGEPIDLFVRGSTLLALVAGHRRYEDCAGCPGGARTSRGVAGRDRRHRPARPGPAHADGHPRDRDRRAAGG
jgi:hypothetical protein